MSERTSYAPGTPCWVDIGTDVDAALPFYTGLFGWTTEAAGPPEETGGYGFFLSEGKLVAGYGPQQSPGPPFWASYVSTDDVDATAQKVEQSGGAVVMPPMDVMSAGRMAVFQDPQGAFISAWQPGEHIGARLVNEAGAYSWNELLTRDADGSKQFYTSVFGWSALTHGSDGPMPYTELQLDGASIAGMMPMPPMVPVEVPSYWNVYFAVADLDATLAKLTELGGSPTFPPMEMPVGRFAGAQDPQGASFTIIKLAQEN